MEWLLSPGCEASLYGCALQKRHNTVISSGLITSGVRVRLRLIRAKRGANNAEVLLGAHTFVSDNNLPLLLPPGGAMGLGYPSAWPWGCARAYPAKRLMVSQLSTVSSRG